MVTLLQSSYLMTLVVMILRLKYKAVKHCGNQIGVSLKEVNHCRVGMKMTLKGGYILVTLQKLRMVLSIQSQQVTTLF